MLIHGGEKIYKRLVAACNNVLNDERLSRSMPFEAAFSQEVSNTLNRQFMNNSTNDNNNTK